MKRTLITNAVIVNEGTAAKGSLVIEGDRIAEVLPDGQLPSAPCSETIDAAGMYLLPGVIDEHVHFRDPGLTEKADMETESEAAAAGGVTSFMDMPNTKPLTTTIAALDDKYEEGARKSRVNYAFFFGATNTNADLLPQLDIRRVPGVKLFMGASTGNMLVDKMAALERIFHESPLLIMTHCEDSVRIRRNADHYKALYGDDPDVKYHPLIRDEEACYHSSALAVRLAEESGARLHIAHVSTARELSFFTPELLTASDSKPRVFNKRITGEACLAHLMFCDRDYATKGTRIKCNPSVKTAADRDALRLALTDNRIDTIGTDHAPHLWKDKQGGCLKAASGMPMIQFSLSCLLELADEGVLPVTQVVEKMCHAPARLFEIKDRGYLRKGYKADMVLVKRLPEGWTVTKDIILSKCKWSPLEGETFHWKVMQTIVNGRTVYKDGQVDSSSRGEALEFDR